jgi:hypothetical protein
VRGAGAALREAVGPVIGGVTVNVREDVLHAMDRLHLLWSISNDDYGREYPRVSGLPPSTAGRPTIVPAGDIPLTTAAIARNQEPTIHHLVARNFLNQPLNQPVGRRMPNDRADVLMIQDSLRALNLLSDADYALERAAVLPLATVTDADRVMPRTLAALTVLKERIAGSLLGWNPFQADEEEAGGDRFGGRTFDFTVTTRSFEPSRGREQDVPHLVSIFIPRGVAPNTNKVHIYFSPRGAAGNRVDNDVLMQGLRGAADATDWILIGVSGVHENGVDGWRTMDDSAIGACLARAGRPTTIAAVRLSGHSRGIFSINNTLAGRLVGRVRQPLITAPIDRVVILDEAEIFTQSRSNAIFYRVNDLFRQNGQPAQTPANRTRAIDPGCARAIGYTRVILNTMVARPLLLIPQEIRDQLLTLPVRGCFSTAPASTLSGCQVNITDFCRTNGRKIAQIIGNESNPPGPRNPEGLRHFIDRFDLFRAGHAILPTIYSHHLFVAEVAHEFIGR